VIYHYNQDKVAKELRLEFILICFDFSRQKVPTTLQTDNTPDPKVCKRKSTVKRLQI
jgi:hypothetical protein